jgi:hypothetical protein
MATPVTRNQFVVAPERITHVPTGAAFTPYPGSPLSGNLHLGQLGNRLPNGDDHRCACRKSNPNILVVQPAQDRAAKNGPS